MKTVLKDDRLVVVKEGVYTLLANDASGHGIDHIDRVYRLSMDFCDHYREADRLLVGLAALLHDVDDYKLVGRDKAGLYQNTTEIMISAGFSKDAQSRVIDIISNMGYSKALRGIRPKTLEGKIVSDADMCDATGANGIMRALIYAVSGMGSGVVFDPKVWPDLTIGADKYNANGNTHEGDSFTNYFFEKMFRVKDLMLTEPGEKEAEYREQLLIEFLRHYFREQNVPEWSDFLEKYLIKRSSI